MNLAESLRVMDAPEELRAFASEHDDFEQTWAECPRADWLCWLAGAASFPLADLVTSLAGLVRPHVVALTEGKAALLHAVDRAEACMARKATREECEDAASAAEFAAGDVPATFRSIPGHGYAELARAAMWTARAAEGWMTARLRLEARRLEDAHRRASWLGGGIDIALSRDDGVRLQVSEIERDAYHADLLYIVAAGAEGAMELANALRAQAKSESGLADLARSSFSAV